MRALGGAGAGNNGSACGTGGWIGDRERASEKGGFVENYRPSGDDAYSAIDLLLQLQKPSRVPIGDTGGAACNCVYSL